MLGQVFHKQSCSLAWLRGAGGAGQLSAGGRCPSAYSVVGLGSAGSTVSPRQNWCLCPGAACGAGREWRTLGVPGRVRSWIAQVLAIHPSGSGAGLVWEEVRPWAWLECVLWPNR